jgi:hypothetical protein
MSGETAELMAWLESTAPRIRQGFWLDGEWPSTKHGIDDVLALMEEGAPHSTAQSSAEEYLYAAHSMVEDDERWPIWCAQVADLRRQEGAE